MQLLQINRKGRGWNRVDFRRLKRFLSAGSKGSWASGSRPEFHPLPLDKPESKHHVYLFLYHLWNNQVGIKLSDHLVGSQKSFDHMSLSGAFPHMSPRFVLQFLVNFTLRGRHRGEDLVLKLLGSILGTWRVSGVVLGRWGLAHWSSTFKFNYIHMKKNNGWMVDKSTVSDFANKPKPLWEKNISEKHWNLTKKTSKFVIWCRIIWQVSLRPKTSWLVGAQCNLTKKKSMTLTCLTPCSNDFWPRMYPEKPRSSSKSFRFKTELP